MQAEIIGTNSVPMVKRYEAYKAQAVASHSYMEYYKARNGKYPGMPYIKPHTKTIELVREVASKLIYYDGKVINASYHAYSGGHTQSSEYVWGGVVPYLRGVPSKYDDYIRTYTLSVSQTSTLLKSKLGITSSGDPKTWFNLNEATKTDGGFVHNIKVCNVMTTGRKLRESVFGAGNLKSPKITSIDVVGENFNFTTNGYGHGVGMSQGGAIGYSENENYSYEQILTKYYTGVVVK
ncbi:MAG: SpoIID/LytB domain-containing protein [Oscillospiraceae bacterium]